jgi:hypothetical protein
MKCWSADPRKSDSFQTVDDHFASSVPEVGEFYQEESDNESDDESTDGPHADEVF